MIFGYARVSKQDSNLTLQLDALQAYGAERIFQEKVSGGKANREQLDLMLNQLRPGDVLVVWKLDRLGRTMKQLVALLEEFHAQGIHFVSLTENFDTTTPSGRLCIHIFCAVAEMERELIRERTEAGLASARARGRSGGRPAKESSVIDTAIRMYETGDFAVEEIIKTTGIGRATLYKYINQKKKEMEEKQIKF